jgi:toxin ParE1/3/4
MTGARSLKVGRHLVFYREVDSRVVILRVVHERRNWAALSFADDAE